MAVRAGRAEPKGQQGGQAGRAGFQPAGVVLTGAGSLQGDGTACKSEQRGARVDPALACQHRPKGRSVTPLLPAASSSAQTHQKTPSWKTPLICPL